MELVTFISVVMFFYGAIYFIDQMLKSCMNLPYLYFLENLGIRISPLQFHIFSTVFNRSIAKWTINYKRIAQFWFSLGAVVVVLLLGPSVYLMIKNILIQLRFNKDSSDQPILQPVVPGWNLPAEEFPYYFFTLLVTSVFHEVGHAAAAVGEDVHINGIGFMLIFVLPAAYVDLPAEPINKLSPFRQLKVFCAGVWHNIVLAVLVFGIGISVPFLTSPFYSNDLGVMILNVDKNSPARGPLGLVRGDIIKSVNYCEVNSLNTWKGCLADSVPEQIGFCIPLDVVNSNDETVDHPFGRSDTSIECCNHGDGTRLCFELRQSDGEDNGESPMHPYSCLPARIAVTSSNRNCLSSTQCDSGHHCLSPSIRNSSRLLYIMRQNHHEANVTPPKNVLFFGPPGHLFYTVTVTNYIPKYSYLPLGLPRSVEILADYLVKFSAALGILNLIPCFYLDGYRILGCVVELLCAKRCDPLSRNIFHRGLTLLGSLLLASTLLLGFYVMIS